MHYAQYIEIDHQKVRCVSPTPEREAIAWAAYPISRLQEIGHILIRRAKDMAVQKLISPIFAEIIIEAIQQGRQKAERLH